MIILEPGVDPQNITVYVRSHTSDQYQVEVLNEETSEKTTLTPSGIASDGTSLSFGITYPFKGERFYTLRVTAGKLLNTSKVFCTSQLDFPKFTVLAGYYNQIQKPDTKYIVKNG